MTTKNKKNKMPMMVSPKKPKYFIKTAIFLPSRVV